ncbi:MAG: hypothetical protein JW940_06345 [Polyangiaceae bacterium]|nr:hypothetical protein [Polyangiaceae bacterium]
MTQPWVALCGQFAASAEAERLAQALALSEGFHLILVYCNDRWLVDQALDWLRARVARVAGRPVPSAKILKPDPPGDAPMSPAALAQSLLVPLGENIDSGAADWVALNAAGAREKDDVRLARAIPMAFSQNLAIAARNFERRLGDANQADEGQRRLLIEAAELLGSK